MYMKDLKYKMTLRLNDELKAYVDEMADKFTISPSDFIRQCIAQNMDARKLTQNLIDNLKNDMGTTLRGGLENGTDRKTDKHDII